MEPVSNYIVLEKYTSGRNAETWTQALIESLAKMPVKVVQSATDEGRGLRHHIEKVLGVHHSSDLFHVQQLASKATSAPLASQVLQAETAVEKAQKGLECVRTAQETYLNQDPKLVVGPQTVPRPEHHASIETAHILIAEGCLQNGYRMATEYRA